MRHKDFKLLAQNQREFLLLSSVSLSYKCSSQFNDFWTLKLIDEQAKQGSVLVASATCITNEHRTSKEVTAGHADHVFSLLAQLPAIHIRASLVDRNSRAESEYNPFNHWNQDSCATIKWGETARTLKHPAECTCPGKGQAHRHLSEQVWEMVGSAQAFYCSWCSELTQLRAITGKGNKLQHKRQGCCTTVVLCLHRAEPDAFVWEKRPLVPRKPPRDFL